MHTQTAQASRAIAWLAPHPSRSAPLCRDCRHSFEDARLRRLYCNDPSTHVSSEDGVPLGRSSDMRSDKTSLVLHGYVPAMCGTAGRLFVARDGLADVLQGDKDLIEHRGRFREPFTSQVRGTGLEVGAQKDRVAAGEAFAESLVDGGLGVVDPAVDGTGGGNFERFHGSSSVAVHGGLQS